MSCESGCPKAYLVESSSIFITPSSYLDAVAAACHGEQEDLASWYRRQLLTNDQGDERVTEDLRRRLAESDASESPKLHHALESALKYLENRPAQLQYAAAREEGMPIGSGATESTCALFQLRVKHPGSHWSPQGLRGAMTARGLPNEERQGDLRPA